MSASIIISVLAAIGAAGAMSAAQNSLKDVQVGEEGRLMRIALVCEKGCNVKALSDNNFELINIDSDLEIPLQGRSDLVRALRFASGQGGSILSLVATRNLANAKINDCKIRDAAATCIDLEFADEAVAEASAPPPQEFAREEPQDAAAKAPAIIAEAASPKPEIRAVENPAPEITRQPEQAREHSIPPRPLALREAPNGDILKFDRFAAPERISPPRLAVVKPAAPDAIHPGALRAPGGSQAPGKILKPAFSLRDQAQLILNKSLGVAECEGAQARLNKDAWALDAMIDVGFCKAMAGQHQDADNLFSRLLAYTPDNYEALVGRALIAAEAGEIGDARGYFQDALNAVPPIEESDLILEAMAKL